MTDTAAKMAVTVGLIFTLAVNLAVPLTVRKSRVQQVAAYPVETVHMKAQHFDVGSLSGGVQWVQAGQIRSPAT